jgi:sugar transferase (PEP-CTERM/EpsH1 system associated)
MTDIVAEPNAYTPAAARSSDLRARTIGRGSRYLFITPRLPYPPMSGFRTRVYQILRHLAAGHDVTLLTYIRPDEGGALAALRGLGISVIAVPGELPRGWRKRRLQLRSLASPFTYHTLTHRSAAMQAALNGLLAHERFDVIQLESSLMSWLDLPADTTVLLDEHNIEYELLTRTAGEERSPLRRLFNRVEARKVRREEQRAWARSDVCIVTSDREASVVRGLLPAKPVIVIPNGVDTEYFRPAQAVPDSAEIVFTGLMSYRPNADGAVWFVREILPRISAVRRDITFTVAGAHPPVEVRRLAGPGITVTGALADVRPHMARAAVLVVPLRIGSGTRLKVVEGLAMGRPVVSTSLGSEGIAVSHGEHLLIADHSGSFAAAVLRLLDDPGLAAALSCRGRALVEQRYSWSAIVQQLETHLPRRPMPCTEGGRD